MGIITKATVRFRDHEVTWPESRLEAVFEFPRLRTIMLKTRVRNEESFCFENDNIEIDNSSVRSVDKMIFFFSPRKSLRQMCEILDDMTRY